MLTKRNIDIINRSETSRILSTILVESDNDLIKKFFHKYNEYKGKIKDNIDFINIFKSILHELDEDFPEKRNELILKEIISSSNINLKSIIEFSEFEKIMKYLINQKGYLSEKFIL